MACFLTCFLVQVFSSISCTGFLHGIVSSTVFKFVELVSKFDSKTKVYRTSFLSVWLRYQRWKQHRYTTVIRRLYLARVHVWYRETAIFSPRAVNVAFLHGKLVRAETPKRESWLQRGTVGNGKDRVRLMLDDCLRSYLGVAYKNVEICTLRPCGPDLQQKIKPPIAALWQSVHIHSILYISAGRLDVYSCLIQS